MNQKFLENKKNISLCSAISAQSSATSPAAHGLAEWRALPHAQAATWAWAGNSASRPISPGLRHWPIQSWPSIQHRMASEAENPNSFSFALSSLLSQSPSERQRREQAASPGAVAGPLAGMRAPQRVSAPPSSGLAAAPLWPDTGEPCPWPAFLFPARRHDCSAAQR